MINGNVERIELSETPIKAYSPVKIRRDNVARASLSSNSSVVLNLRASQEKILTVHGQKVRHIKRESFEIKHTK